MGQNPRKVTVQVPGMPGGNAFTNTRADFVQPAIGSNINITVNASAWMVIGQYIYIGEGGEYLVISIVTSGAVTVQNTGALNNVEVDTIIPAGVGVSPSGPQGAAANPQDSIIYALIFG